MMEAASLHDFAIVDARAVQQAAAEMRAQRAEQRQRLAEQRTKQEEEDERRVEARRALFVDLTA